MPVLGQWKDLTTVIEQSLKDGKARVDQLHTYEKLRDQAIEWLTKNEARVDPSVTVDADILKRQTDELRVRIKSNFLFLCIFSLNSYVSQPTLKEWRDYEATIGRVADLGIAYENMTRLSWKTTFHFNS